MTLKKVISSLAVFCLIYYDTLGLICLEKWIYIPIRLSIPWYEGNVLNEMFTLYALYGFRMKNVIQLQGEKGYVKFVTTYFET